MANIITVLVEHDNINSYKDKLNCFEKRRHTKDENEMK